MHLPHTCMTMWRMSMPFHAPVMFECCSHASTLVHVLILPQCLSVVARHLLEHLLHSALQCGISTCLPCPWATTWWYGRGCSHTRCVPAPPCCGTALLCAPAILQYLHVVWVSSFTCLFQHLPVASWAGLFACLLSAKPSAAVERHTCSQPVPSPSATLQSQCAAVTPVRKPAVLHEHTCSHLCCAQLLPGGCLGTYVRMTDTIWKYRRACFCNCLSQ